MIKAGPDEKIYPVVKLTTVIDTLAAEGISPPAGLEGVGVSEGAIRSPLTRVSLNQIIRCYGNAIKLSRDPRFAYRAGLRFHVSAYGMYGFAILSSTSFRQTVQFAVKYHNLATPLADISFGETTNRGIWSINPVPHPVVDAVLYRFLVEMQFGIHTSLHRDTMGPSFTPLELQVTFGLAADGQEYSDAFGCPVRFGQSENKFLFDAAWLDAAPQLGNEVTYSQVLGLCDELLDELQLSTGLAGKVRQALLVNLARPTSFDAVARYLKMTPRTLRRKLQDENTSFRELLDELRMHVAIKYLRDTDLTIENVADALGFSDAANFRHAFRRWTRGVPQDFRAPFQGSKDG
jgi:AraC-like DNA-binding protein